MHSARQASIKPLRLGSPGRDGADLVFRDFGDWVEGTDREIVGVGCTGKWKLAKTTPAATRLVTSAGRDFSSSREFGRPLHRPHPADWRRPDSPRPATPDIRRAVQRNDDSTRRRASGTGPFRWCPAVGSTRGRVSRPR